MTATINASTSAGVVVTSDTSGSLALQTANTTAITINSSQVVNFANTPTIGGSAFPSGAMTLISTLTASSSSFLSWTGLSGYNNYLLILDDISASSSGDYLSVVVGEGSTPTYLTSGYAISAYGQSGSSTVSGYYTYSGGSDLTGFQNFHGNSTNSGGGISGNIVLNGMQSGFTLMANGQLTLYTSVNTALLSNNFNSGYLSDTNAKTAIKLNFSGNIASGKASLYGISS